MLSRLKKFLRRFPASIRYIVNLESEIDRIKINQGQILEALLAANRSDSLKDHEFKVFSQWGEDGILQWIIDHIDIRNKTFIEFGVEDFRESNCRYLLMSRGWSGFVIDGSESNVNQIRRAYWNWRYNLVAMSAFVTRENVDELLSKSGFDSDLGILSVDIDGMDYHVLQRIEIFRPRVIVAEYNALFGDTRSITVPYDPTFRRGRAHYTHLYFGASIAALTHLASEKGYALVGTNSNGVNAFFIRRDLLRPPLRELSVKEGFTPTTVRQSRDRGGQLDFLAESEQLRAMSSMPVLNVITGDLERL
jgi:hypothetical protein